MDQHQSEVLPKVPVQKLTRAFNRFIHIESSSGVVLMICTILALVVANSPWQAHYAAFWEQTFTVGVDRFSLSYPIWYWVNDALMAIFFFVIGLEIKRELVAGELRNIKSVLLPAVCAVGGAVVPAIIFLFQVDSPELARGWAIPMATDIAFAVGVLSLFGARVPRGLKVFLLSLAIIDDMIAVLVIAIFYGSQISFVALGFALCGLGVIFMMNRLGVRSVGVYGVVGAVVWLATLKSGIHPTIAGVLLGLMTPLSRWIQDGQLSSLVTQIGQLLDRRLDPEQEDPPHVERDIALMSYAAKEAISPLHRLEGALHPWVAFGIMPLFALANAGVAIEIANIQASLSLAIMLGLVLGKPIGICLAALILTKLNWANLPAHTNWRMIIAVGFLAGIGFTMSLFIGGLSFDGVQLDVAKTGILFASLISALIGVVLLATGLNAGRSHG